MNTFHDLFRQPTRRVGSTFPPDRRRELFPGFVERSPKLHLWTADQPVSAQGLRLLIGVATWSGYDLNLLDLLEEAPDSVRVDVVDVDSVSSPDELARLFPGLSLLQTPFVGYWSDGKLLESASGFQGRQLVARVCEMNSTEVEERMKTITSRV